MADKSDSDDDFDRRVRLLAARRARQIVNREGRALVTSARDQDEDAIIADSRSLTIEIAQAILDACAGDLGEDEEELILGPSDPQ